MPSATSTGWVSLPVESTKSDGCSRFRCWRPAWPAAPRRRCSFPGTTSPGSRSPERPRGASGPERSPARFAAGGRQSHPTRRSPPPRRWIARPRESPSHRLRPGVPPPTTAPRPEPCPEDRARRHCWRRVPHRHRAGCSTSTDPRPPGTSPHRSPPMRSRERGWKSRPERGPSPAPLLRETVSGHRADWPVGQVNSA